MIFYFYIQYIKLNNKNININVLNFIEYNIYNI